MAVATKKIKEKEAKIPNAKPEKLSFGFLSQQRIWSRFVVILGVITYIWYTAKDGKETPLAKQKDVVQRRGQVFECDSNYLTEVKQFANCEPKKCGRYISDKIVTTNEVEVLLKIAKRGFALGSSDRGVSILDLHSGALSFGEQLVNIHSFVESKNILNPADLAVYKIVKAKIQHAIAETFQIGINQLQIAHPTFFSRVTNLDPKTVHNEYWHVHVDEDVNKSFHYTSVLYLADYGREFAGGRLTFLDTQKTNVTLEPRKGRVVMFTSGRENTHHVERVASGTRYAMTVSFSCDVKKAIKDPVTPK
ncbi:hypothetical protein PPYR_10085 [Photinus pyralis]|uniref:Fe2OG dioxygenase domain-containing protein n=1 Tax=Photinus pyralis TaxID=7054 RepID=A0A5N4AFD2_PHOPY|nr:2-oxoglutarate and iron-dependent oxygenase domain-containing protein 3-like [Photinus pyralis]KAB0796024.1 hypothetical protein PPYR_10085 [Photinus pyralis]